MFLNPHYNFSINSIQVFCYLKTSSSACQKCNTNSNDKHSKPTHFSNLDVPSAWQHTFSRVTVTIFTTVRIVITRESGVWAVSRGTHPLCTTVAILFQTNSSQNVRNTTTAFVLAWKTFTSCLTNSVLVTTIHFVCGL